VSFGPPPLWWKNPGLSKLDQHPIAHALGGGAIFAACYLYYWLFHHVPLQWFFAAIVSGGQLVWEIIQVEVTPGYSFTESGIWDWLDATIIGIGLAALVSLGRLLLHG
jgi:hypothetical protein